MRLNLFRSSVWGLFPMCFVIFQLTQPVFAQTNTLGLGDGFISFNTSTFSVQLVKDSQTLYSLKPLSNANFDFIPADKMSERQSNGNYHLGDITFRVRKVGSTAWLSGDTSTSRKPVTALHVSGTVLAAANLSSTLPSNSLLTITRQWVFDEDQLQLLFVVKNSQTVPVEIGALGMPLEFNNIFTDRTAAETNEICSLFDPYIGQDAGFVQVTPLLGTLPSLVLLPVGKSPLEGWRFLPESTSASPFYQSQTFEGLYEWQSHTLAYAQNEWSKITPWNSPTSVILQPGENRTYGIQFRLAPSIREIENTIISANHPVAAAIPGYILPADQVAKLFLSYSSPVQVMEVSPAGALSWSKNGDAKVPLWSGYDITPHAWGRARLSIVYADGTSQTVHYYLTKPGTETVSDLGSFLTTSQWFNSTTDPFKRSPSIISYDREANAIVQNDPRAWIPGLSDEAGAGSWLAAAMKEYAQPNGVEVSKLEQFIDKTLWGTLQNIDGSSVYFYQPNIVPNYTYPTSINWGNWWSWNQAASFATDRAYDYVHVTAAYWALYRVARNYPDLVKIHSWEWYLNQAVLTVLAMTNGKVGFAGDGLMGETVFLYLLDDLKREGLAGNASLIESRMESRATVWAGERYPFGSEMAWDSTGQEGVYGWSKYFGNKATAVNALNSILAYQPLIAHWGYNGNARRYWDNIYGGKLQRIERQIHHYGSGLNALPLASEFESNPSDFHLLRVGYAGLNGPLSNIDQAGFASASFHSFADTLKWDGYSGDYGPNFSGHTMGMGTYIINHPEFGWQAFGGNVIATSPTVQVQIRDSIRRRVYIAPLGTLLTLDSGSFSNVEFDPQSQSVTLTVLAAADGAVGAASATRGRLIIQQKALLPGVALKTPPALVEDAGAWVVPFVNGQGKVTLTSSLE
ncbi:hypothetical protein GALMADRAFT_218596 [Galerina marginata CBS 339.88]|uniref:Uncharacterized protein n=1 Tax=Galerina marginata (strain CBS 339.88) TaxID=685588 RepID=A0A067TZS2_GALM3|nr:hypothetical protein GALMADRAFT_218596 [Galerina marginata CBS 339.88]